MIRFFKNLFKAKDPGPAPEAPYKVEAPVVDAVKAPVAEKPNVVAKVATQAKKKRTFVKREDSGVAKVAKVKAPAKPRAPAKPKAK